MTVYSTRTGLFALLMLPVIAFSQVPAPVELGVAARFRVLAASSISNVSTSAVTGNIGLSPSGGSNITGFGAGEVTDTIFTTDGLGPAGSVMDPTLLSDAKADLLSAYNEAAGRASSGSIVGGELAGLTLTRGVYTNDGAPVSLALNGTLTLDAEGDPSAVWIFQSGSTLITAASSVVSLMNGAQWVNVFWKVASSATIGSGSDFKGNLMAAVSITVQSGTIVEGRVLASGGAVTLNTTTALPVELASFAGAAQGTSVGLTWTTATEVDNYGFEVERCDASGSNNAWTKVGFVEGNGTSTIARRYTFSDRNVIEGTYAYRLKQIDRDGTYAYSYPVDVRVGSSNDVFSLSQNYPNPFNPSTVFQYTLDRPGFVTLKVFDVLGEEIASLVNAAQDAGTYTVSFNTSETVHGLSSGVYFYRLDSGVQASMRKFIFMK